MDNNITSLPLSALDEIDLEKLAADEPPKFHPILEVWRAVLKPAAEQAKEKVTPSWASRIVAQYNGIEFGNMDVFRALYFGKIAALAEIVDEVIASDSDCLTYPTMEEDAEENAKHYREVLFQWQAAFVSWELQWDCLHENAAVEIAALAEVHKMFLGQNGLTAFLENINFEFTEADQAEMQARLEAFKEGE